MDNHSDLIAIWETRSGALQILLADALGNAGVSAEWVPYGHRGFTLRVPDAEARTARQILTHAMNDILNRPSYYRDELKIPEPEFTNLWMDELREAIAEGLPRAAGFDV